MPRGNPRTIPPMQRPRNRAAARGWFNAKQKDDSADILIYDVIGAWGISAQELVKEIKGLDVKTLNIFINTPGGDVFDGTAIYNALRGHPAEKIVHIDGVAASAGSWIAMAGDTVKMADNAWLMMHDASGFVWGYPEDMRRQADLLEKMSEKIANIYAEKSGQSASHFSDMMNEETWFDAEEAKAEGLIDEITEGEEYEPATANFNYAIFNKIPDEVLKVWKIDKNHPPGDSIRSRVAARDVIEPAAPAKKRSPVMPLNASLLEQLKKLPGCENLKAEDDAASALQKALDSATNLQATLATTQTNLGTVTNERDTARAAANQVPKPNAELMAERARRYRMQTANLLAGGRISSEAVNKLNDLIGTPEKPNAALLNLSVPAAKEGEAPIAAMDAMLNALELNPPRLETGERDRQQLNDPNKTTENKAADEGKKAAENYQQQQLQQRGLPTK